MNHFAISKHSDSNREDTTEVFLYQTPKKTSLSLHTLIQEFQPAVLEKNELDYRDNTQRSALLPLLFNQHSNIDVESILHEKRNNYSASRKNVSLDTLMEKRNKQNRRTKSLNTLTYHKQLHFLPLLVRQDSILGTELIDCLPNVTLREPIIRLRFFRSDHLVLEKLDFGNRN